MNQETTEKIEKLEAAVRAVAIDRAIEWAVRWKRIDESHAQTIVGVEGIQVQVTRDDEKGEFSAVVL